MTSAMLAAGSMDIPAKQLISGIAANRILNAQKVVADDDDLTSTASKPDQQGVLCPSRQPSSGWSQA